MSQSASTPMKPANVLGIALVLAISVMFYSTAGLSVRRNAISNDFLGFYAAGVQVCEGDGAHVHDYRVQYEYQKRFEAKAPNVVPFPRPRFYAEVFRPLAALPIGLALNIWQAVQVAGLIGVWILLSLRYRLEILQLTAFFYPLPIGIGHGQDTGLMAFFAAMSLYLWQAGSPFAGGAVLALCLFKWHLVALLPVAMLIGRQWRLLQGFTVVAALLLMVDFAIDGAAGWQSYIELLSRRDLDRMTPGITFMPNVQGLFANLFVPQLWWIGLIVVLACFAVCSWRLPWPKAMLAAQLSAVLIVPHVFQYDLAFTLFPLAALLTGGAKGAARWSAFVLLVPPIYFCTLFGRPWAGLVALMTLTLLAGLAWEAYRTDGLRREAQLDAA